MNHAEPSPIPVNVKQNRLYHDLAWLWHTLSPPEDYAEEAEYIRRTFESHSKREVKTLLELGCGGGHTASHLKSYYTITGVDLSPAMLENSIKLNPEIEHVEGDMRSVRLGRLYDLVLIHDAVNYMLTEADLKAAFQTAWEHLEPGGVLVTFIEQEAGKELSHHDGAWKTREASGLHLTYFEELYDPDPTDTTYEGIMIYIIRQEGELRVEADLHICGIFPHSTWTGLLEETGFKVELKEIAHSDFPDGVTMPMLIAVKPRE